MNSITSRKEYEGLLAKLDGGEQVADEVFDAMFAFAKAKKLRRPARPKPPTPVTARRAKREPVECCAEGCDRGARARGMCPRHHTAWWRAQDPERMERAREASRRYAARKRAERDVAVAAPAR